MKFNAWNKWKILFYGILRKFINFAKVCYVYISYHLHETWNVFMKWTNLMKYGYKNDCLHHIYRNLQHIFPMKSNLFFHIKNLRAHFFYLNHKSWRKMCFCKPCFCSHISYMVSPNFNAVRLFMRVVNIDVFISINIFIGSSD